jgi:transcriptional regulator with XRE-family HTH domain
MDAAGTSTWARYLDAVTHRPGWSVARLARESGVHRSTIFRWLNGEVSGATVGSVMRIASAVGDDPDEALRAAADLLGPAAPVDPDADAVSMIMESDLPVDAKHELLAELRSQARSDARRRRDSMARIMRLRGV